MEQLKQIIENYNVEVIIILGLAFLVMLILYTVSQIRISHITDRYDKLIHGMGDGNLEEILVHSLEEVDKLRNNVEELENNNKQLSDKSKFAIQKVGIIRYNAFADMGSELSFSIALLDDNLNGFITTSIYGRENSTVYAKPIINGKSKYALSVEEIQAIDRAAKNMNYMESY